MNEISISTAISKLHAIIVSFFLFIFLSLLVIFISILNGVEINNLRLPSLIVEKLYIKWDQKLIIRAQKIEVILPKTEEKEQNYRKKVKDSFDILKNIYQIADLLQDVDLKTVHINDTQLSFRYKRGEKSFLVVRTKDLHILTDIDVTKEQSIVHINKFENSDKTFHLHGTAVIDNKKEKLSSQLELTLLNDTNMTLLISMDTQKLFYKLQSRKAIGNLPSITKMAHLPSYLNRWIYDAIKMKDASLQQFYGFVEFAKPEDFMRHIYADAHLESLQYTFDTRLAPIITSSTHLIFSNGVLHIYPKDARFHVQELPKSYLDIDLNPNKYLLCLYLQDYLSLDRDVVNLLKTYKVDIPFMQTTSKIDTHLNLFIKLKNFNVDANGSFALEHGAFVYKNMNLNASNAFLTLKGSQVDIKNLTLVNKESFETNISGSLNPTKHEGRLEADITQFQIDAVSLSKKQKVHLIYNVLPKEDKIFVSQSSLQYKDTLYDLASFTFNFDLNTLIAKLPKVEIGVENKFLGSLWGDINLNDFTAALNLNILKLQNKKVKLDQNMLALSLKVNKNIEISSKEKSAWQVGENKISLGATKILYANNKVQIAKTDLTADTFSSTFVLDYDLNKSLGEVVLQKVALQNEFLAKFFNKQENYALSVDNTKKDTAITFKKYNTTLLLKENNLWSLTCKDFSKIYKNVPLFKDYNITNGDITLASTNKEGEFLFDGSLQYPYKFLVKNNIPLDKYRFSGSYSDEKTDITINNELHVRLNNGIKIQANHLGFNIPAFVKFKNEHIFAQTKEQASITAQAKESYLYFSSNRKMLADTLNVQYCDSELTAQLQHAKGKAGFNLNKYGIFYLHGSNFNDTFMEKLFATSRFSSGALSFTFNGAFEEFSGIIEIQNTILQEYKALNNVFAFVNTVPSLVTFSVPDYSQKGLHVENMYVGFTSKKGVYDLSDLSLASKEIKIYGKGKMNLNSDTLDMDLNLKTDLASKASQIPIVGYILFGKESISTSLKVQGSIYDPNVSTSVAKDMIIAPLNIIKRTLLFPIELFSPSKKDGE